MANQLTSIAPVSEPITRLKLLERDHRRDRLGSAKRSLSATTNYFYLCTTYIDVQTNLPVYLRQEELIGVLAGLDALASQTSDLLAHLGRVFRLADGDEQLPELGHQTVEFANHLDH